MGGQLCSCNNELEAKPFKKSNKEEKNPIYECVTCWGYGSDFRLCSKCATNHHSIHNISEDKSGKPCRRCICCSSSHIINLCSKEIKSGAKGKEQLYQCKDCFKANDENNTGICAICSKNCHLGHRVRPIKIVDKLICCCGEMGVCAIKCKCSEN